MQTTHIDLTARTLTFTPAAKPFNTPQGQLFNTAMGISLVAISNAARIYIGHWYAAAHFLALIAFLALTVIPTLLNLPYYAREAMIERAKKEAGKHGLTFVLSEPIAPTLAKGPESKLANELITIGLVLLIVFLTALSVVAERRPDLSSPTWVLYGFIPMTMILGGWALKYRFRATQK